MYTQAVPFPRRRQGPAEIRAPGSTRPIMTEPRTTPTQTSPPARRAALRQRIRTPIPAIARRDSPVPPVPFVLRLRARDNQLLVTATGLAGRAEARSPLPKVEAFPREVAEGDTRPWKIACRIGERLYTAVFPAAIAALLDATLQRAADDAPVPIVLQIEGDDLLALPWELLRDPERERFLSLSPRTPLSRAPAHPRSSRDGSIERGNLRVTLLADSIEEDALAIASAVG